MKRLLFLLLLTPMFLSIFLSGQTPTSPDQSSVEWNEPPSVFSYVESIGGGATMVNPATPVNTPKLGLLKDLALLASGVATGINPDGSLQMVPTGTVPTPNAGYTALLGKYAKKVTASDGATLFPKP